MARSPRRPLDAYETPEHYVRVLLDTIPIRGTVLEPCVGDGAIARFFPGCVTNDIDPKVRAEMHLDASKASAWKFGARDGDLVDWVITNPPFNAALPILEHALANVPNVAMVLRISFFEPTKERETFLVCNPPQGVIYLPRFSFTGNGKSDMATCLWAVWSADPEVLDVFRECPIRVAPRFAA